MENPKEILDITALPPQEIRWRPARHGEHQRDFKYYRAAPTEDTGEAGRHGGMGVSRISKELNS